MDEFNIRPIDNSEVSKRIRVALLEWIRDASNGDEIFKLPNENELARKLNVSRTGLRDALTVMEGEGYITRRRGIGTLVNPKIARCRTRLDITTELSGLIAAQGQTPSFKVSSVEFVQKHRPVFNAQETSYLRVEKVFYADGIPTAYCVDRLAGSLGEKARPHVHELMDKNLFDFIKEYLHVQNAYVLSDVLAEYFPPRAMEMMGLEANMPALKLGNVSYDYDHVPYMDSELMLRTDILKLQLLRKPI